MNKEFLGSGHYIRTVLFHFYVETEVRFAQAYPQASERKAQIDLSEIY